MASIASDSEPSTNQDSARPYIKIWEMVLEEVWKENLVSCSTAVSL